MKKAEIREQCRGCAYDSDTRCEAFTKRIANCWNHTTKKEAANREKQIDMYTVNH